MKRIDRRELLQRCPVNPVTRFAPSPTGDLHLGHLLSLLYLHAVASTTSATVLCRLEDHDRERCRHEYAASILTDLEWLGFPFAVEKPTRQSDRPSRYLSPLTPLLKSGEAYYCDCSRKQIAARQADTTAELHYGGFCRHRRLAPGKNRGIRLRIPEEMVTFHDLLLAEQQQRPAHQCGDLLLRDTRGNFTYNYCVVVDDLMDGVNLIIRGSDLLHCTGRQLLLQRRLGGARKVLYVHHPLLLEKNGQKLSKSGGSSSLRSRREAGDSPPELFGWALDAAGISSPYRPIPLERTIDQLIK